MKHYIIDGNNLIGKDKILNQIQKKNKQQSREKLSFMLSRYFSSTKSSVSLHFDGFEKESVKTSNLKIIYSNNSSADNKIKSEIEKSKNRGISFLSHQIIIWLNLGECVAAK